jgi:hypothetical protein
MTVEETVPVTVSKGTPIWRLKQWMYEAVLKGQYTVEQFSTLVQQRQAVKEAIFSQGGGTAILSTSASSDYCSKSSDPASTILTSIASSHPEVGTEPSPDKNGMFVQDEHHQRVADQPLDGRGVVTVPGLKEPFAPSYPACTWTCCQTCRPTYRDRAWQSLDLVLNASTKAPTAWEFKNQRISDARILANISLPNLDLPYQVDDSRYVSYFEAPLPSNSNFAESDIDKDAYGALNVGHTKSCFQATVRAALTEAIGYPRASSGKNQKSSKSSCQTSLRRLGRSIMCRSRSPSQSIISYDPHTVDDSPLQESLMLMAAINTPLPDVEAGVEELHHEEVEEGDGLAGD